jgi:hypothetical protein
VRLSGFEVVRLSGYEVVRLLGFEGSKQTLNHVSQRLSISFLEVNQPHYSSILGQPKVGIPWIPTQLFISLPKTADSG